MNYEYREVPAEDIDRFEEIAAMTYAPEDPQAEYRDEVGPATIGERRGVYKDDELVAGGRFYPCSLTLNDNWIDSIASGSWFTLPEYRNMGISAILTTELVNEARDRGIDLITGWAFKYRYWSQYGGEVCSRVYHVRCDLMRLNSRPNRPPVNSERPNPTIGAR